MGTVRNVKAWGIRTGAVVLQSFVATTAAASIVRLLSAGKCGT